MRPVIGVASKMQTHPELPMDFRYVWLEGRMKAKIAYVQDVSGWDNLDQWPAGRLFGETGEYRWRRNPDGTVHGVILSDDGKLPEEFNSSRLELEIDPEGPDSDLILWGEWVDPSKDPQGNPDGGPLFYTQEIPQVQAYPVLSGEAKKDGKTPRLVVRRYRHESKGEFVRCVHLIMKGAEEERA
ncbi:MAG: hypothetical protein DRH50_03560 [Deltaproteobacteria bacterium]|nr:MAG: hypothetical protein DRH50_03560 [Deltaproteobacteria bacterium]